MLQMHIAEVTDELVGATPAYEPPVPLLPPLPERSTYQPSRRQDLGAGILSVATVSLLLAGFAWVREPVVRQVAKPLTVLNLQTPQPPPPRPASQKVHRIVPHQQQPIFAPKPLVVAPAPSPVVAVSSPAPVAPIIPARPAPPMAAAPVAAPQAASPIDGGDLTSKMVSAKAPTYPLDSRRKNEEGTVVLTVLVGTDGRVDDVAIFQSSGFDRLDRAALSAVRDWRWVPLVKNGSPVEVQGRVKIPFVLNH